MLSACAAILGYDTNLRGAHQVQSLTDQKKDVIRCLLEDIQDQQRQIFPDHAPTFNNSLKNKIILIREILRILDRYPKINIKQILYLIECKIEGEKFLLDFYNTVELTDPHFDNMDNLEHIRFLIRQSGKVKWDD
jgi:hypothetical protein